MRSGRLERPDRPLFAFMIDNSLPEIRTVYRDHFGSISSDGNCWQAWRQHSQWHVERIGEQRCFYSFDAAKKALREERLRMLESPQ